MVATGAYEGYWLTTSVWAKLTKRRQTVSLGTFVRSIEKKEHHKISKTSKYEIELDLRRRGLLFTDPRGHKWVLPKPVSSY